MIGQEPEGDRKMAMMEAFIDKHGKDPSAPWVLQQMQTVFLKANNFDKALDAGTRILAVDPMDVETSQGNLKASEGKKDPALILKWSNMTSAIARKVVASLKPKEDDEVAEWTRLVDYARQVDIYTEYSLYATGLGNPDPKVRLELFGALEKRSPNSQYLNETRPLEFVSLQQVGDKPGALAKAEQLLAAGQPNHDALLFASSSYFEGMKDKVKAAQFIAEPAGATQAAAEAAVTSAMSLASKTVDAVYTLPYLAHATMEVLNCTVSLTASSAEVWAPTQTAIGVQTTVAALTGLPVTAITVHTTYLGGGLGRKIEQDYISQAVQVAMAVGKPVKLVWSREEDFGHDQYRPMAAVQVKGGIDSAGNIAAWYYRNVSPGILAQRGSLKTGVVDSQASEGSTGLSYAMGLKVTEWVPLPAGIPVGFWRSVGSSINAFAVECMIDELAVAAGMDPFDFRYRNLTLDPRAVSVLRAADTLSSWRRVLPAGHAWGMAITKAFNTWVCEVVDISGSATSIKVNRVACVVDCGQVINPGSVEAQMQGGIAHGLNAALWGEMTFTAGVAQQKNFSRYRMMRPAEMPTIAVQVIPSTAAPTGIGEPGVPPIAPALANAYFKLTGKRVRSLPFFPGATMSDEGGSNGGQIQGGTGTPAPGGSSGGNSGNHSSEHSKGDDSNHSSEHSKGDD